ncbi:MAG: hypothetical protein NC253_01375 [Ruminococcus sp.]|nr:hypothetical protein [Ruminococcus sp.]MCM1380924.1 hypothetical protein [Muribaculaceae bacterium]MCM1480477.1 hypothetical protein [Muribaculaceae bacterium]
MNRPKIWESTRLYKNGEVISTSSEYIDNHNMYTFYLIARFKEFSDAEIFAQIKSKNSKPFHMFSVTENLKGDTLGAYYVYVVRDIR